METQRHSFLARAAMRLLFTVLLGLVALTGQAQKVNTWNEVVVGYSIVTAYANGITRTIGDDVTFYYGDGDNVIVTGDANGDGQVTLADAVAVVNYILGKPSVNFNIVAADMNGDGNITITDAVSIVNMLQKQ